MPVQYTAQSGLPTVGCIVLHSVHPHMAQGGMFAGKVYEPFILLMPEIQVTLEWHQQMFEILFKDHNSIWPFAHEYGATAQNTETKDTNIYWREMDLTRKWLQSETPQLEDWLIIIYHIYIMVRL